MDIGYLLNSEVGEKVPPLRSGKIPLSYLPPLESFGASQIAIATHIQASNPHSQYSLVTHTHTATSVGADPIGSAAASIVTHTTATDPHSQYSLVNHSHTAGSIGADASGTADRAVDQHEATFDPHPNYLNVTRLATALTTFTWYNLTLVNGWSGVNAQYSKLSNGLIIMRGLLSKSNKNSGEVISTLPIGYRPAVTQRFVVCDATKDSQPFIDINTNGQIIFNNLNPPNNTIGLTLSGIIYVGS